MNRKTSSWTYALSRFYSYDKLIYASYIPFQPLLHMMHTWKTHPKNQPSAHTGGWHVWLETADATGGFTKTEGRRETVRGNKAISESIKGGKGQNNHRITGTKTKQKWRKRRSVIAREDRGGRSSGSFGVDEQPIRLPDELQLNRNPQNGDKHTPASPVCLPQTPLNDCKH